MKAALLFPGQGSQYIGMGKEFVEKDQACAGIMELAESVCKYSLREIIFNGPMEELTRSAVLQPAITVTNLICFEALKKRLPAHVQLSSYAGHSLGEYSALCAAKVLSIEDAIKLVERRGFLMEREGKKNPGGMRAVIGLRIDQVEEIVGKYSGVGVVTVANYNTEQQIVISGTMDALDYVSKRVEDVGGKAITLNVSVANHSPLVADAVPDFKSFLAEVSFSSPELPVYFNVSAEREADTAIIKEMMAKQIASRVRWFEIIRSMLEDGVDTFIEVGPKNVLKGMMRKIVPKGTKVTSLQFDSPQSLDACLEKLG